MSVRVTLRIRVEGQSDEVVPEPTAEQLGEGIRRLDNASRNELSVEVAGPSASDGSQVYDDVVTSLLIGGGHGGRVCVSHVVRDMEGGWAQNYRFLVDPSESNQPETQIIGGQPTTLPARWWVLRDMAVRAGTYFLEHHGPDPALTWELDQP